MEDGWIDILSDDEGRGRSGGRTGEGEGGRRQGRSLFVFILGHRWSFTILEGKYGRVSSSCAVESCPFA